MRYIKDDVRYMPHEVRIAEGYMAAPERAKTGPAVETCFCGKTVIATKGRPTGVTCPRECKRPK